MQMLNSEITNGSKNKNQKQLGISNRSAHKNKYPFLKEFSELISIVPTKTLKTILITPEQENLAQTLWGANRSKQQLDSSYKPKINTLREYYERVLIVDHKKQWDDYEKSAIIDKDSHLE
jgi:hypothetical protein|tara:strand:+ start:208 stop:567 length:360 start_codon:yes stop_codon:yes gene_type:complete